MRTDITQTYHRHKRKGGTKSKRRRGRASERERARERKVDRKTDRQTDRERKETQPDRQGQNSVCASRSPSEKHTRLSQKHTRLCVVWGAKERYMVWWLFPEPALVWSGIEVHFTPPAFELCNPWHAGEFRARADG